MQDLSHLAVNSPVVGSEAATNTVTETQPFSGKGTDSESTSRIPQGSLALGTTDTLDVNYPPGRVLDSKWGPTPVAWKDTIIDG